MESGLRLALWVAYDGSPFRGFAPNIGVPTVSGRLADAIETALRFRPHLTCAGRTDAGVHGRGQVVTFDVPEGVEVGNLSALERSINGLCRPEVVVWHVAAVPDTFDARFSAQSRSYRYTVLNARVPDPLRRTGVWHVWDELDLGPMRQAAAHLVGTHDFSSFCRKKMFVEADGSESEAPRTRTLLAADWRRPDDRPDELIFDVVATSFCQQMVRSLVGACVDVGRGRVGPDDIPAIIAARDRKLVPTVAPPTGLVLMHVGYERTPETAVFLPPAP